MKMLSNRRIQYQMSVCPVSMHLAVFALDLAGFGWARPSHRIWRFQFKHETAAAPDRWCHLGVAERRWYWRLPRRARTSRWPMSTRNGP